MKVADRGIAAAPDLPRDLGGPTEAFLVAGASCLLGILASHTTILVAALVAIVVLAFGAAGASALLAVVVIFSGVSLNFISGGPASSVPISGSLDSVRLLIVLGGVGVLWLRQPEVLSGLRHVWVYLVFLAFAGISVTWSPSAFDGIRTLSKLAYPCVAFLLTASIVKAKGDRPVLKLVLVGAAVATVWNFCVAVAGLSPFQGPGYEGRYRGALHPNSLGLFCATTALVLYAVRSRLAGRLHTGLLLLMVGQVVATGSRTAIISGGAAFITFDVLRGSLRRALAILAIGAMAWVAIPTLGARTVSGGVATGVGLSSAAPEMNLSGRALLWADVWAALMGDHQVLGRGIGATDSFFENRYERMRSVHNGYIQLLVDLGVLGLGLFVTFFLSMAVALGKRVRRIGAPVPYAELALGLLVGLSLASLTESTFSGYGFPVAMPWIAFALALFLPRGQSQSAEGSRHG